MSPVFDPYKNRKVELSIDQGCLIWGNCVVIPKTLQPNVLESLHEAQPGMYRMKSLVMYFWWVIMDENIAKRVQTCESCQKHQLMPASTLIHPWGQASNPWVRLHIDYLG